jgi:hypothetical protein
MNEQRRLESAQNRLTAVRAEQQRQMQFVGVRLGVKAKLQELGRAERRLLKLIDALSNR